LRQKFVILAQTATKGHPGKGPFHDPSTGEDTTEAGALRWEAMPFKTQMCQVIEISNGNPLSTGFWRVPNDLNTPFELFFDPLLSHPAVPLINPNMRDTWKLFVHPF
jgi:hypothetical protein